MSEKEKAKTDETPATQPAQKEGRAKQEKPGKDYVFRIVPADPKNSFDFEDVADK